MLKIEAILRAVILTAAVFPIVGSPALAQTTSAARPALTYSLAQPLTKSAVSPVATPVPGDPASVDFTSASDSFSKAVTARGNGDLKTACLHATAAVAAMQRTKATDRTNTNKMYADLKAMVCAAKAG